MFKRACDLETIVNLHQEKESNSYIDHLYIDLYQSHLSCKKNLFKVTFYGHEGLRLGLNYKVYDTADMT